MPTATKAPFVYRFPAEITLLVLENAPNHSTLHAAVLTCRKFHDCYAHHRETILRGVLDSEFGPAVEFARALQLVFATSAPSRELNKMLKDPPKYFSRLSSVIPTERRASLTHFCTTARKLEDYFSIMCVDCSLCGLHRDFSIFQQGKGQMLANQPPNIVRIVSFSSRSLPTLGRCLHISARATSWQC